MVIQLLATWIPALLIALSGVMKLSGNRQLLEGLTTLGVGRYVRLLGVMELAFATLLFLCAVGLNALASILFGRRDFSGTPGSVALIILFVALLVGLLAVLMRRVGSPLGDVVEAANRVASGDYTARVAEHGPPSLRTVGHAFNSIS